MMKRTIGTLFFSMYPMQENLRYSRIEAEIVGPHRSAEEQLLEIQRRFVAKMFGILDPEVIEAKIKSLWSAIEPLWVVDANDHPINSSTWEPLFEFRKDIKGDDILPEEKEQPVYCRISLIILEDTDGNVIVSRRSPKKWGGHAGMLEIAWGHVIAGDSYAQTVVKELSEEVKFTPTDPSEVIEKNRLLRYRNTKPTVPESKGKWNMISIYKVRVPSVEVLVFDPNEIQELITLTPEKLYEAIANKELDGIPHIFADYHAYWYLEYLQESRGINTEALRAQMQEAGVMKGKERIATFDEAEKV